MPCDNWQRNTTQQNLASLLSLGQHVEIAEFYPKGPIYILPLSAVLQETVEVSLNSR